MDYDSDRVVACLNLEEILNNYNTWKHLTVGKLISLLNFYNVNLFIFLTELFEMELFWHLTVCKQNLYLY